jgi:hypothetical protein
VTAVEDAPLPETPAGREEYVRLVGLGVSRGAALVLAVAVERNPRLRGDDRAAYARHRRHASPLARAAHAAHERERTRCDPRRDARARARTRRRP